MPIKTSALLLIIFMQLITHAQIIVRPPSEDGESKQEISKKGPSRFLRNGVSTDLSWLARGGVSVAFERSISDYLSLRIAGGPTFGDFLDGRLYDGFKFQNEGILDDITANPSWNLGLEMRYYSGETGYYDSFFWGIGLMSRRYSYQGIFNPQNFAPTTTQVSSKVVSKTNTTDFYIRYGSFAHLHKSESGILFLEYGLILGLSVNSYDLIYPEFTNPFNSPGNVSQVFYSKTRELNPTYLILPVIGLGYAF